MEYFTRQGFTGGLPTHPTLHSLPGLATGYGYGRFGLPIELTYRSNEFSWGTIRWQSFQGCKRGFAVKLIYSTLLILLHLTVIVILHWVVKKTVLIELNVFKYITKDKIHESVNNQSPNTYSLRLLGIHSFQNPSRFGGVTNVFQNATVIDLYFWGTSLENKTNKYFYLWIGCTSLCTLLLTGRIYALS